MLFIDQSFGFHFSVLYLKPCTLFEAMHQNILQQIQTPGLYFYIYSTFYPCKVSWGLLLITTLWLENQQFQHYILSLRCYNGRIYKRLQSEITVILSVSLVYVDYFPLWQVYNAFIYNCRKCDLLFEKEYLIITGLHSLLLFVGKIPF